MIWSIITYERRSVRKKSTGQGNGLMLLANVGKISFTAVLIAASLRLSADGGEKLSRFCAFRDCREYIDATCDLLVHPWDLDTPERARSVVEFLVKNDSRKRSLDALSAAKSRTCLSSSGSRQVSLTGHSIAGTKSASSDMTGPAMFSSGNSIMKRLGPKRHDCGSCWQALKAAGRSPPPRATPRFCSSPT